MTNKIVIPTADEFLAGFTSTYVPLMPLFLSKGKAYPIEEGSLNFKRLEAMGDLHNRIFGSKDTEIKQIHSKDTKRTYSKFFLASQYRESQLQDKQGYNDIVSQVLDEHNKQNDVLFATGSGTDNNTVLNNGLFFSKDPNYIHKSSYEVKKATDGTHLADLYSKMISIIEEANIVAGQKLVLVYGDTMIEKYNSLFSQTNNAFSKVLSDALPGVSINKVPKGVIPAGNEGFIVVNMDQILLHYTTLPVVRKNGTNEEKDYVWTNFIMGSSMLEVKVNSGIIKQPLTFAA